MLIWIAILTNVFERIAGAMRVFTAAPWIKVVLNSREGCSRRANAPFSRFVTAMVFLSVVSCEPRQHSAQATNRSPDTTQFTVSTPNLEVSVVNHRGRPPRLKQMIDQELSPSESDPAPDVPGTFETSYGETGVIDVEKPAAQIWLNACSTIQIPTPSVLKQKSTVLQGEALIRASKDSLSVCFGRDVTCSINSAEVFISCYPDDGYMSVICLSGKSAYIHLKTARLNCLLRPGESIQIYPNGHVTAYSRDTAYIRDLTKNSIVSGTAETREVFRRISRWYGIAVEYRGELPTRFWTGNLGQDQGVENVVNILNATMTDYLTCKLTRNAITVTAAAP